MRSRRKEAAKATTRKEVALESLKTVLAIKGDARTDRTRTARAIVVTSLRLVLATAPAVEGFLLPILAEMKRVAASGRASWVMVVNAADAAARRDTSPIWERLRIRIRMT